MNKLHPFIELKTVDSTNLYAEQLLKTQKVREGTVIFAYEQTSGKGQGENTWESEPGKNALFSLVLFPGFLSPAQQFLLNKVITLGVLDFLSRFHIKQRCSIKWPNDIYAGNSKLGGVLIQNTVCGSVFESCIAGIGVNINQETFSPGLRNPVSLKQIIGKEYPVKDAVDSIVAGIDKRYHQLKSGVSENPDREYSERLLWIKEWKNYSVDKKLIKGKILGVDEFGGLILKGGDGRIKTYQHDEIGFVFH